MKIVAIVLALSLASMAFAESSPSAGRENRPLKSLSSGEEAALLNGEGRGLAKSAELNGYPGPRHVLDLEQKLELSVDQVKKINSIYQRMHEDATRLGRDLVDRETALEQMFASQDADSDKLMALSAEIGSLNGRLRATHLLAHLETRAVMTDAQIQQYKQLRGYSTSPAAD